LNSLRPLIFAIPALLLFAPTVNLRAQALQARPAPVTSLEDRRKALNDLFEEYWQDNLRHDPEMASTLGDKRYNDQIDDNSVKAFNEGLARERAFLFRLAAIDATGFTDQEKLSRELLLRQFADDEEAAEFKTWEMPVNQMGGIHTTYPQLVAQLSFTTVKDYDDWISRLHQIPKAFDQVTTNMSIGMEDKRVPPKYLLEKVLAEVKDLGGQKPEDSPFALPLKSFPADISADEQTRIKTEMLNAIQKDVMPAYARFARFLEVSYIPAGREQPGISALPDGAKFYQFLLHQSTTTDLTPAVIHQIGLDEVKKDEADMLAIAQKLGFQDLKAFSASVKANPKMHAASGDALLDVYRGYLIPMQQRLPQLFGTLPKAKFEVVPVPDYLAKTSAPAYYQPGAPDGSRPGRLFINTWNAPSRNLYQVEDVAYHEGLPGHHLQISIAQELKDIPTFRKYQNYSAYAEGWGLYSERLGKDVGLYQDPYSDFGRLQGDIWRAIRLVVDTGVHSQHWTRDQMVQYFHDHSSVDDTSVNAEVDRYIAWPGQATAYKIGQLKILELRDRAKSALGNKFDLRAFHDQVIDAGALPLDLLSDRIDSWIAAQKSAAK
jgi:uncharacterized protein (DUF885 family)